MRVNCILFVMVGLYLWMNGVRLGFQPYTKEKGTVGMVGERGIGESLLDGHLSF